MMKLLQQFNKRLKKKKKILAHQYLLNKIALENIQILYNYLQQNNDIQVNSSFVSGLKDLKWKINRKQNDSLENFLFYLLSVLLNYFFNYYYK